jgi:hypothetical protein
MKLRYKALHALQYLLHKVHVACYRGAIRIEFHATITDQFERLVEHSDVSHPIVIARYDLHTLRRTPPNEICPYVNRLEAQTIPAWEHTDPGCKARIRRTR